MTAILIGDHFSIIEHQELLTFDQKRDHHGEHPLNLDPSEAYRLKWVHLLGMS